MKTLILYVISYFKETALIKRFTILQFEGLLELEVPKYSFKDNLLYIYINFCYYYKIRIVNLSSNNLH